MRHFQSGRHGLALSTPRHAIAAAIGTLMLSIALAAPLPAIAEDLLAASELAPAEPLAAEPLAAEPLPAIEPAPLASGGLTLAPEGDSLMATQSAQMAMLSGGTEDTSTGTRAARFIELDAPHTGAFTRNFPIEVPPYFEITPKLSLAYSSSDTRLHATDGFSPLGVGWRLTGGSVIERTSARGIGTPLFDDTDKFLLDGNTLMPCDGVITSPSCAAGGTHATRYETYERIERVEADNTWVVTARNGTKFTYRPLSAWSAGTDDLRTKYRWLLAKVEDTDKDPGTNAAGNVVNYSYTCSIPVCTISAITYRATSGPLNEILFYWETRTDTFTFATGLSLSPTVNKRLKTISVRQSGAVIRAYKLSYTVSPDTRRSLLSSIQQFGRGTAVASDGTITGGSSLPADTFAYDTLATRRAATRIEGLLVTAGAATETSYTAEPRSKLLDSVATDPNYVFGDFNGDNKTDLLVLKQGNGCEAAFYPSGHWDASTAAPSGGLIVHAPSSTSAITFCTAAGAPYVGDFNGDGRDDLATITTLASIRTAFKPAEYETGDAMVAVLLLDKGETEESLIIEGSMVAPIGGIGSGSAYGLNSADQPAKMIVGDFNGDGKDDFYRGYVFLSNGTIFTKKSWANRQWGRPGDFNGDGRTDLFVLDGVNGVSSYLLYSTGSAFTKTPLGLTLTDRADINWPEFESPYVHRTPRTGYYPTVANPAYGFRDGTCTSTAGCASVGAYWNDVWIFSGVYGTTSLSQFTVGNYTYYKGAQISVEETDSGRKTYTYQVYRIDNTAVSDAAHLGNWSFADINGDGLTDALQTFERSDGSIRLYANTATGSGFVRSTAISSLAASATMDGTSTFNLFDMNGDGQPEYLHTDPSGDINIVNHIGDGYPIIYQRNAPTSLYRTAGDFNGDGKLDLAYSIGAAPTGCPDCVKAYNDSLVADLMRSHVLSSGGGVSVQYLPSTYWSHGYLPTVLQVVSKITTGDGRGHSSVVKYGYDGGAYNITERKFLGFKTVVTKLPCEADETAPSCPWIKATYEQHPAAVGAVKLLQIYNGANTEQRRVTSTYAIDTSAPFTVLKTAEQIDTYPSGVVATTNKTWAYDAYGNVTKETDLGLASVATDDLVTSTIFAYNLDAYLVNFPRDVTLADPAENKLKTTRYRYDGAANSAIPATKGHVTGTFAWYVEAGRWIETSAEYDGYGQLVAETDPLGNRSVLLYDSTHQFVTKARNPLYPSDPRQENSKVWDAACGVPLESRGFNDELTSFTYDALCRLTGTTSPTLASETVEYKSIGDPDSQYIRRTQLPVPSFSSSIVTESYFDGLGREYRSRRSDVGTEVVVDTEYALRGAVLKTSLPYFTGQTPKWTTSKVDVLGRPILTTLPDGKTITTAYVTTGISGAVVKVKTTDASGRVSYVALDAHGRELQRIAYLAPSTDSKSTRFTYDRLGQHVGTTDPAGNVWAHAYDSLGHRISSADPDLGLWTYTYDDAGQLIAQTDAKGQITSLGYDVLGRVITKVTALGLANEETTTSTYDQARPGFANAGVLTTTANAEATITYDYDIGGRLVQQATTVDGATHTVISAFDAAGRLTSRTYPDGSGSGTFTYDAAGRQSGLAGAVTATAYNAAGQVTSIAYANGATTTYAYDADRSWLTSATTTVSGTIVERQIYAHDDLGRIISVTAHRTSGDWTYGYDTLDRLIAATNTGSPPVTFTYDDAGNMLTNSAIGTYTYPAQGSAAVRPHAVTAAGDWTFTYDANGNQLTRSTGGTLDREITYDGENRPVAVNGVTYRYGPDGARLKKIVGSDVTLYLGDDIERDPTGAFVTYLTGDVKRAGGVLYVLHRDHQSSVRAITDAAGLVTWYSGYQPYGEQVATSAIPGPTESKGYIGERTDPETGLTYLHARYYDATLGRFLQPDWWSEMDPGVGTNHYAYALNDPINLSDPNGHVVSDYWLKSMEMYDTLEDRYEARGQVLGGNRSAHTVAAAGLPGMSVSDQELFEVQLLNSTAPFEPSVLDIEVRYFDVPYRTLKEDGRTLPSPMLFVNKRASLLSANRVVGAGRQQTGVEGIRRAFPGASVQAEQALRDANGLRARDPLTGKGRRLDAVVLQDGVARGAYEVTSLTARKDSQIARENRIRAAGGTFVIDRSTGKLVDLSHVKTELLRLKW